MIRNYQTFVVISEPSQNWLAAYEGGIGREPRISGHRYLQPRWYGAVICYAAQARDRGHHDWFAHVHAATEPPVLDILLDILLVDGTRLQFCVWCLEPPRGQHLFSPPRHAKPDQS